MLTATGAPYNTHNGGDNMKIKNITNKLILFDKERVICFFMNVLPSCYISDGFLRAAIARFFGAKIGKRSVIKKPIYMSIPHNIAIGDDTRMAEDTYFDSLDKITLGNNVTLGPHILFITGNHEQGPHKNRCGSTYSQPISIEDGCWIAAGVLIGPGVTIGAGSIVCAGSVVLRSMPPDRMIAGNPARAIQILK